MSTTFVSLSRLNRDYLDHLSKDNTESKWMSEIRQAAFSKYNTLPLEVSPLYSKYSDANKLEPDHVRFSQAHTKYKPNDDIKERIKELEKDQETETSILRIGSHTVRSHVTELMSKQGVLVIDLEEALKSHGEIIRQHLMKNILNYEEDKFLALSGSSFQSGIFVYVPRNVTLENTIRLVNTLPEMVTLQAMDEKGSVNFSNRKAFIERDAKISWYMGLFGSKLSRYKIDSIMKGAGASAEDVEIIFGIQDQSFDVTSNLIHYGESSRGRVLSKSVMKDKSKSLFKGMIKIGKEAK